MSTAFNTPLTRLLGIRTPLVLPPMTGPTGGVLTAQVVRAGGFAFLPTGFSDPAKFPAELSLACNDLGISDAGQTRGRLPFGAGALGWQLDTSESIVGALRNAIENHVKAVWLSFGADLGKWVNWIRTCDDQVRADSDDKILIFVLINSVEDALIAVKEWKADAVIAQGIEAGGHGSATAPPLQILLPSVLSALQSTPEIPVIAAGGISNGTQLASVLTLGASGAVLGTRFLFSHEAIPSSPYHLPLLLSASSPDATVRSSAFDRVFPFSWPKGIDGRALMNQTVRDADAGATDAELIERLEHEKALRASGKHSFDGVGRITVWAGMGVSLVDEVKHGKDIVKEIHEDAVHALRSAAALVN